MRQFNLPAIGKQVRVTSRFPSVYYFRTTDYDDFTYSGVVGKPDKSVPAGSFLLVCQDPVMPTRVICLQHVIEMEYLDGGVAETSAVNDAVTTWQVEGSNGNVYTVVKKGNTVSCNCPGYTFRKNCKHTK